jgi:hypothetical protein
MWQCAVRKHARKLENCCKLHPSVGGERRRRTCSTRHPRSVLTFLRYFNPNWKRSRKPSTSIVIDVPVRYCTISNKIELPSLLRKNYSGLTNSTKNKCQLPSTWNPGIPDASLQITKTMGSARKRKEGRPREYTRLLTNVHEDIRFKER